MFGYFMVFPSKFGKCYTSQKIAIESNENTCLSNITNIFTNVRVRIIVVKKNDRESGYVKIFIFIHRRIPIISPIHNCRYLSNIQVAESRL